MAQILNIRQRSQSFLKFLLFFVITVLVIITAVYFDFKMPWVENRRLKEEVYFQRQLAADQERFANKMDLASALLDSIEKNPSLAIQLSLQFDNQVRDMNELNSLQQHAETFTGRMNQDIIDKLVKISELNKKVDQLRLKAGDVSVLEIELQKCKDQLTRTIGQFGN